MKYRKTSLFLATLMLLSMLGAAFVTVPMVKGYTITVDGDATDWLADASAQAVNTGQLYGGAPIIDGGEYVWKDALDDDIGDGDYRYPCNDQLNPGKANATCDLLEWRVTANTTHLMMLFKMADVADPWSSPTGFSGMMIVVLIDQDHKVGSGQTAIPRGSDGSVIPEKAWEWAISLKGWDEIWKSTDNLVLGPPTAIDFSDWGGMTPYPGFMVRGSTTNDVIEVAVPFALIGQPCAWNFMVFVGHEDSGSFREVQVAECDWTPGGGVAGPEDFDAFDAAFYSSTAIQTADWADGVLGNEVAGEGWEEITVCNQPDASLICYDEAQPKEWNITCDYKPCQNFTVIVEIQNIVLLKGAALNLTWDPRIKEVLDIRFGPFWGTPGSDYIGISGTIDNVAGTLTAPWGASRLKPPLNGSGIIYEIDFHVKEYKNLVSPPGDGWIRVTHYTQLLDPAGKLIFVGTKQDVVDGCDKVFVPTPPTAIINENATMVELGQTIHLWSTSLDGDNGTAIVLINREDWTIKDSLNVVVLYQSLGRHSSIDFTATYADTYTVLLEVWAQPNPGYDYDSDTKTKTVYIPANIFIDCYTAKARRCGYEAKETGFGPLPGLPADAYMLDELVRLYAWVVYNNNPMQARLVSFEVYDAQGNLYLVKQNMTDANGLTFIEFRIPTECLNYSRVFGKWRCFQKVMLCDLYYTDTVWWDVGWIIELQSVQVIAQRGEPPIWQPVESVDMYEHIGVNIVLKNRAMNPRNIVLSVAVFDDNDVVVIQHVTMKTIPGGEYCDPFHEQIEIICMTFPKWTYPGVHAHVEVSAWFNALPTQCGHCACPDVSDDFIITAPVPPPPDP